MQGSFGLCRARFRFGLLAFKIGSDGLELVAHFAQAADLLDIRLRNAVQVVEVGDEIEEVLGVEQQIDERSGALLEFVQIACRRIAALLLGGDGGFELGDEGLVGLDAALNAFDLGARFEIGGRGTFDFLLELVSSGVGVDVLLRDRKSVV